MKKTRNKTHESKGNVVHIFVMCTHVAAECPEECFTDLRVCIADENENVVLSYPWRGELDAVPLGNPQFGLFFLKNAFFIRAPGTAPRRGGSWSWPISGFVMGFRVSNK